MLITEAGVLLCQPPRRLSCLALSQRGMHNCGMCLIRRRATIIALAIKLLFFLAISAQAEPPAKWTAKAKSAMAGKVRGEFLRCWMNYKRYAWGHDELQPISKRPHDWYGVSLYMTPVDALDTMRLMGLTKEADEAQELICSKLSFDQDIDVKAFEIGIRLLGSLLSNYQISGDKRLLALADDLGRRMLPIFNSPTGMPYVSINLKTGKASGIDTNPAEVGTYLLEFGTLSKLTGKPIYFIRAKRAVTELFKRQSIIGLVGSEINVETGKWTSRTCHIGGGIDSYYEYLLKSAILFSDKDCNQMWESSVAALNKYVAEDASNGLWYGPVDMNTGVRKQHSYGALDAFFPAVLALSGDLKRAERLEDSCFKMWNLHGIEPERLDYAKMKVTSPGYPLRPEIVESSYYLYSFTKSPKYLDMGQTMFEDLEKYCRTDAGFAELSNVETKEKADSMESFFFAETLKYFYLLFAPPKTLDLKRVVFNTEAHPLRASWKK